MNLPVTKTREKMSVADQIGDLREKTMSYYSLELHTGIRRPSDKLATTWQDPPTPASPSVASGTGVPELWSTGCPSVFCRLLQCIPQSVGSKVALL